MTAREIPADLWPYVEAVIALARGRLEQGEELTGVAFVDAPAIRSGDPVVHDAAKAEGVAVVPMKDAPTKDAWARLVRTVASLAEARFILIVSEAWFATVDNREAMREKLAEFKEVRFMPGRREVVMVQLETHDGLWQGEADVVPLALSTKGGKTFGKVEMHMPVDMEGRFIGLLGRRRPRQ